MVFPYHRYRGTPCQRFAGIWRSYLPPQSFLPVGIGEATPVTNSAFFDFVSLHSLSYLWVSGRRGCWNFGWRRRDVSHWRHPLCPSRRRLRASHASIALGVVLTLALILTSALVDAWDGEELKVLPVPSTWLFLYG